MKTLSLSLRERENRDASVRLAYSNKCSLTFRDKQPCLIFYRARLRGGSRATASIEPLSSLIRLSIMSSLEQRRRRCRLLVRRLVQPKLDGVRGPPTAGTAPSAPCDSQD